MYTRVFRKEAWCHQLTVIWEYLLQKKYANAHRKRENKTDGAKYKQLMNVSKDYRRDSYTILGI